MVVKSSVSGNAIEERIRKAHELVLSTSLDLTIMNAQTYERHAKVMIKKQQFIDIMAAALDPQLDIHHITALDLVKNDEHKSPQSLAKDVWDKLVSFYLQETLLKSKEEASEGQVMEDTRSRLVAMGTQARRSNPNPDPNPSASPLQLGSSSSPCCTLPIPCSSSPAPQRLTFFHLSSFQSALVLQQSPIRSFQYTLF